MQAPLETRKPRAKRSAKTRHPRAAAAAAAAHDAPDATSFPAAAATGEPPTPHASNKLSEHEFPHPHTNQQEQNGNQNDALDEPDDDDAALWDDLRRGDEAALAARIEAAILYPQPPETETETESTQENPLEPSAPSLPRHQKLYPTSPCASAPPLALLPHSHVATASIQTINSIPTQILNLNPNLNQTKTPERPISPTPESSWRQIYSNDMYVASAALAQDVRSRSARLSATDPFFDKLLSYETAAARTARSRSALAAALAAASAAAARIWTLAQLPRTATAVCSDGRSVSHAFMAEHADLSHETEAELVAAWASARNIHNVVLATALFETTMSKIWIQNTLDAFMAARLQSALEPVQSKPFAFEPGWEAVNHNDADVRQLLHFLAILFHFEHHHANVNNAVRAGASAVSAASANTSQSALSTALSTLDVTSPIKSPTEPRHSLQNNQSSPSLTAAIDESAAPTDNSPSTFVKDIRGWIAYVVSALIRCGGPSAHHELLLNVVRCRGIGRWGAHFIQWPLPSRWTEPWANHYLASLRVIVSAVEELEEAEAINAAKTVLQRANLKRLEDEDEWIVVDERLFAPPPPRTVVCLSEDDLVSIFHQFNLVALFESLVFHCIGEHTSSVSMQHAVRPVSDRLEGQSSFVFLFAFAGEILSFLERACVNVPSTYRNFLRQFCGSIVAVIALIGRHLVGFGATSSLPDNTQEPLARLPTHIILWHPHPVKTTIQAEFDGLVHRLVRILLSHGRLGIWDCLSGLPLAHLSAHMRRNIASFSRLGSAYLDPSDHETTAQDLSLVLLRDQEQARFLLAFLVNLVSFPDTSFEETIVLVQTIFDGCLLEIDAQDTLLDAACESLATLCRYLPATASQILSVIWSNFDRLESVAETVFARLPLNHWSPDPNDTETLKSLLNDPILSGRFRFAQTVIDRIAWRAVTQAGSLLVPLRLQRSLAIHLVHRVIDRQGAPERQSRLGSMTATAARATVEIISKQATSLGVPSIFPDEEKVFLDWCWKTLLQFELYEQPQVNTAFIGSAHNRPFEMLENPVMAALHANAESNALAAYAALLVSEIGHHHVPFASRGWSLLNALLSKGPPAAFLQTSFVVFRALVSRRAIDLFDAPQFSTLFEKAYQTKIVINEAVLSDPTNSVGRFVTDTLRAATQPSAADTDVQFTCTFWIRSALADKRWMHNPNSLSLLDTVCAFYICAGNHHRGMLHAPLVTEYHAMLAVYHTSQSNAFRFSYMRPMASVYSLASTIEHLGSAYPTIVPSPARVPAISGAIDHLLSAKSVGLQWPWLVYEALTVETLSERDMVRQIGRALVKNIQLTVQQAIITTDGSVAKPLDQFAIFRWAAYILEFPLDHPAMPLMWQGFFSLYLERASGTHALPFGYKFFASHTHFVQKLKTHALHLALRSEKSLHQSRQQSTVNSTRDVSRLYRAFAVWIDNPKTIIDLDSQSSDSVTATQHDRLLQCNIFNDSSVPLWLDANPLATTTNVTTPRSDATSISVTSGAVVNQLMQTVQRQVNSIVSAAASVVAASPLLTHRFSTRRSTGNCVGGSDGPTTAAAPVFQTPAAPPPIGFRAPLIPAMETLTLDAVLDMFDRELHAVTDAAAASEAIVRRLDNLHRACLDSLRQLYTNNRRRVHLEKSCSQRCTGNAIVQCDMQEAVMNVDMRNLANEHAQQAELVLSSHFVDARLCVSGLRILRAMDWMAEYHAMTASSTSTGPSDVDMTTKTTRQGRPGRQALSPTMISLMQSTSVSTRVLELDNIFFSTTRSLSKAEPFAPAVFLADAAVRRLGPLVISMSPTQTERIFLLLAQRECVKLLARTFDPCQSADRFPDYYMNLASEIDDTDIDIVFESFDLRRWVKETVPAPGIDQQYRLFGIILNACETRRELPVFRRHLKLMLELNPDGLWRDCIPKTVASFIQGRLELDVIRDLMALVGIGDQDTAAVSNPLVSVPIQRDAIVALANNLVDIFRSNITETIATSMNHEHAGFVVALACAFVCSRQYHSLVSDVHLSEAVGLLTQLVTPWILLKPNDKVSQQSTDMDITPKFVSTFNWTTEHAAWIMMMVTTLLDHISRVCSTHSKSDQITTFMWSLYTDLVESKVPSTLLSLVHDRMLAHDWSSFTASTNVTHCITAWKSHEILTDAIVKFVVCVVGRGKTQRWSSSDVAPWRAVLIMVYRIDTAWETDTEKTDAFASIDTAFVCQRDASALDMAVFVQLVQELPTEWEASASTTLLGQGARVTALSACLGMLRQLGGLEDHARQRLATSSLIGASTYSASASSATSARANLRVYVNYICTLIDNQLKTDQFLPVLRLTQSSFEMNRLPAVIAETLRVAEMVGAGKNVDTLPSGHESRPTARVSISGDHASDDPLFYSIQSVISLFNSCPSENKHFAKLWEGLTTAADASTHALTFLGAACLSMSSVEHMALMTERCIGQHMQQSGDPQQWVVVADVLEIPELEESTFIRHCLNHALVLTLYAHVRKRLALTRDNTDLKIMIGEQLGVWIASVRVDNVDSTREIKMMLLLMQFGNLLRLELSTLLMPEHHSRLRAHLPEVGDALLRWGETRASQGIWATLGFGPASKRSAEFRLCARVLAMFVTSRLLAPVRGNVDGDGTDTDDPLAQQQRARILEELSKMRQNANAAAGPIGSISGGNNTTNGVLEAAERLIADPSKGLDLFPILVDGLARKLFPDWTWLAMPPLNNSEIV